MDLLRHKRQEAAEEPPRKLPPDAPLPGKDEAGKELPLQVERGVRRRLEKMRTAETPGEINPVKEAKTPQPEPDQDLKKADPQMRHQSTLRKKLQERKKQAKKSEKNQSPTPPKKQGQSNTPDSEIAAKAVNRLRRRSGKDLSE